MTEIAFETRFVLGALATWRIAHLIAEEDGPADVVVRLRARAGESMVGAAMDCLYCLSIWVAAPVTPAVAPGRRDRVLTWLALSGAACLVERVSAAREQHVDGLQPRTENGNGLLWSEATRA